MAETKRNRRSSQEKWESDLKILEGKVKNAHEHYKKLQEEYEKLKNNPPQSKSRTRTDTLIKNLAKHPDKLARIFAEANGDQDKLKKLLIEAQESEEAKED